MTRTLTVPGTRLYYKFYGEDMEEESAFENQMDMLCREIGQRGKININDPSEGVPPNAAASASAKALPSARPTPVATLDSDTASAVTVPSATPHARSSSTPNAQLQSVEILPFMERFL